MIAPLRGDGRVAILGLGQTLVSFVEECKPAGGRGNFDEVWGLNSVGDIIRCDRVFHMDDIRVQEVRAAERPGGQIEGFLKWMKDHPGPIYTSRAYDDYPGLVEYPLEDVINSTGAAYLNNTGAYAVALAVHLGASAIACFGMDYTYPNLHQREKGRGCVEFWLGIANARGIAISVPDNSTLLDAQVPQDEKLYGFGKFGSRGVKILPMGTDRIWIEYTENDLPTAAEVEMAYNHRPTE